MLIVAFVSLDFKRQQKVKIGDMQTKNIADIKLDYIFTYYYYYYFYYYYYYYYYIIHIFILYIIYYIANIIII